jgi:hypothetical protein
MVSEMGWNIFVHPELDISTADGCLPGRWRKWEQTMKLYLNIARNGRDEKD